MQNLIGKRGVKSEIGGSDVGGWMGTGEKEGNKRKMWKGQGGDGQKKENKRTG